jgi:cell division protein ZapA
MSSTEPVRVTIFNQTYSLVATDDASQLEELAHTVDELMQTIAARAGNLDSTRIAVLACLHMADQLRGVQKDLDGLKQRIDDKAREFSMLLDGAIGEEAGQGS